MNICYVAVDLEEDSITVDYRNGKGALCQRIFRDNDCQGILDAAAKIKVECSSYNFKKAIYSAILRDGYLIQEVKA